MGTPKLQINLFTCQQKEYRLPLTLKMIEEISKSKYASDFALYIYTEPKSSETFKQYFSKNKPTFKIFLAEMISSSYPDRVAFAHKSQSEYSCKLDDDVLMSSHVWDFVYENLDKLTVKNPVMVPIFTNGVPSADLFVQDFLDHTDIDQARNYFLTDPIADSEWGLDYSSINREVGTWKMWDDSKYWNFVSKANTGWDTRSLPWYYYMVRGVHPARYSREYNIFIADKVIQNKEKFFAKNDYRLETYKAPYVCNNVFFSKTEFWRTTYALFTDGWDEGQLTLQMDIDKAAPLYIRNGFAIHMAYGMTRGQREIESYYINNLFN
jgi:hypothetical protein